MADSTGIDSATLALTANTSQVIELTGRPGRRVELIHHGNSTEVVYYKVGLTEAIVDTLAGGGADEEFVLLPGERLLRNVPRKLTDVGSIWIGVRSAGTPRVSVELVPGGM